MQILNAVLPMEQFVLSDKLAKKYIIFFQDQCVFATSL